MDPVECQDLECGVCHICQGDHKSSNHVPADEATEKLLQRWGRVLRRLAGKEDHK